MSFANTIGGLFGTPSYGIFLTARDSSNEELDDASETAVCPVLVQHGKAWAQCLHGFLAQPALSMFLYGLAWHGFRGASKSTPFAFHSLVCRACKAAAPARFGMMMPTSHRSCHQAQGPFKVGGALLDRPVVWLRVEPSGAVVGCFRCNVLFCSCSCNLTNSSVPRRFAMDVPAMDGYAGCQSGRCNTSPQGACRDGDWVNAADAAQAAQANQQLQHQGGELQKPAG